MIELMCCNDWAVDQHIKGFNLFDRATKISFFFQCGEIL